MFYRNKTLGGFTAAATNGKSETDKNQLPGLPGSGKLCQTRALSRLELRVVLFEQTEMMTPFNSIFNLPAFQTRLPNDLFEENFNPAFLVLDPNMCCINRVSLSLLHIIYIRNANLQSCLKS